jgi:hypothetical protein
MIGVFPVDSWKEIVRLLFCFLCSFWWRIEHTMKSKGAEETVPTNGWLFEVCFLRPCRLLFWCGLEKTVPRHEGHAHQYGARFISFPTQLVALNAFHMLIRWEKWCLANIWLKSNKKFWEELIAYFPWYYTGHIENDASNNSSIVACVFVTAVTFYRAVA